jgi:2-iminobutanoate/2-iminopropanoate deaminase
LVDNDSHTSKRAAAAVASPEPPPYSSFRTANGFVITSGHTPLISAGRAESQDFEVQAHQVFSNLRTTLEAAGSTIEHVVKVNAYLQDLADAPAFNRIYREYFCAPYPARTTVQVGLPGFLIEIDAMARDTTA